MSAVNPGGGGGGGGDLQTTLALGNFTGGNDIELSSGDELTSVAVGVTDTGLTTTVRGGPGGSTSGAAGNVTIIGGTPVEGNGGRVSLTGSAGVGTNRTGGGISILGGSGTGTAASGDLDIRGGNGLNGNGGPVQVLGGNSTNGAPGNIVIGGGQSSSGSPGGSATLRGGTGGTTATTGGSATVNGGDGSGPGGSATVRGGNSLVIGNAGSVVIQGGTPTDGNGGDISVFGTDGVGTNRNGGTVTIRAGAPTGTGSAGDVLIELNGGSVTAARFILLDTGQPAVDSIQRQVVANSSGPQTINNTQDRWTVQTNEGAAAEVVFELPSAVAGLQYTFVVENANGVQIDAGAGDSLQISTAAAGTSVESTDVGSVLTLLAINSTTWVAISVVGTWTVT